MSRVTRVIHGAGIGISLLAVLVAYAQERPIQVLSFVELTRTDWGYHYDVAVSPDESLIAVATDTGIHILDETLQVVADLEDHIDSVYSIDWNSDGTLLASGGQDATIRIWDMVTTSSTYLTSIQTIQDTGAVHFVGWSPTASHRIATRTVTESVASSDYVLITTAVRIWNTSTNQIELTLGELATSATELDWNSDGSRLAAAGATDQGRYQLFVWDSQNGEITATSNPQLDPIRSVAWRPNSNIIAFSDVTGATVLFDASISEPISFVGYERGTSRITAVDWNSDGSQYAIGSRENYLLVYDASTGQVIVEIDNSPDFVLTLDWGSAGSKIASIVGNNTTRVFEVDGLPVISGTPTTTPYPS